MDDRPPPPPPLDPPAVRAIVFDLDGTLIDSYAAIAAALNHARERFGLVPLGPAVIRGGVGRGLETLIAEFCGADRITEGVGHFRERYAQVWAEHTSALPGAREALAQLAGRGYRLAVASNKPSRFSRAILERLGMLPLLATVLGPDDVDSAKPDPRMIRECLRRMRARAPEALYVGDMVLDVETAARAGLPVVLVCGGSSSPHDLAATGQLTLLGGGALPAALGVSAAPLGARPA